MSAKAKEIEVVERILSRPAEDWPAETTDADVAASIVSAIRTIWDSECRDLEAPLHVGLAFKTPWSSTVRYVQYMDDSFVWIVDATSRHGWLSSLGSDMWDYRIDANPHQKTRDKMKINDEGLKEGAKLAFRQGAMTFEVVAVAPKCALLRDLETKMLYSDSNDELVKHYRPV